MPDLMDSLVAAMARFDAADAALDAAWGDKGDGRSALPQAEQLAARIEVGNSMRGDPSVRGREAELAASIASLETKLAAARRDPADRRRCLLWRSAMTAYEDAIGAVAPLYTEGVRLYGDRLGGALASHTGRGAGAGEAGAGGASHAQGGLALH